MELSNRARPISEVLKDERTPPSLKKLLSQIPEIKQYGESRGIKATNNYTEYVKLDRPAAVWVVSACEPLKFEPKQWSFPLVGSFTYLGWFDGKDAKEFGAKLKEEGWDVDVRGARAYSTLGWFKDAVLSTMIPEGEAALGELVNVVLHESVHATLYVKGQSYFNESVASFVADKLTPQYLKEKLGEKAPELESYVKEEKEGQARQLAFHKAYLELSVLYASEKPDAEKKSEKAKILETLSKDVGAKREINNATLIQFKTYGVGQAEFDALLRACGRDWGRFWGVLEKLKSESFQKPQQEDLAPVLLPLAREGCKAG